MLMTGWLAEQANSGTCGPGASFRVHRAHGSLWLIGGRMCTSSRRAVGSKATRVARVAVFAMATKMDLPDLQARVACRLWEKYMAADQRDNCSSLLAAPDAHE